MLAGLDRRRSTRSTHRPARPALTRAVEGTARAPGVAWVVCVGAVQVGTDGLALDIGGDAWPMALFGDACWRGALSGDRDHRCPP